VTPYVILFIERDGSTYLTSLLTSHPEVRAVYERFAVMRQKGERAQAQLQWARDFLSPPIVGASAAIGFKTKLVDVLDPEGFAEVLRATRSRVLQMQRRNHVKAVVSRINARRLHASSGNWNLYHEEDRLPPLAIDVEEFERDLQERAQAERELESYVARLRLPALRLVYEDLLGDREGTLQKVFSFLGLRPMRLQEKTLKHTSDDLRQAVLNFDDLRARYAGTAYEPMFDERLQSAI
jgi:LPS sulfotransferase NodH